MNFQQWRVLHASKQHSASVAAMNEETHPVGQQSQWLYFFLFISSYVLLDFLYFKIPVDTFVNVIYYHGVVKVCADLINLLAPLEQVFPRQNHLLSAKADLEIVRGCDGAGVLFLLVSAIMVFPSKLARKLTGLMLGIGLIYSLNMLRIGTLYFVIAYHPAWFMLIHTYLAPTLMVIMACAYFAWWAFASSGNCNEPA